MSNLTGVLTSSKANILVFSMMIQQNILENECIAKPLLRSI